MPTFNYKADLHYHTSALLALGLDTLTLPWRSLHGPYASPSEVAHGLSGCGRKIASLDLVLPFTKPSHEKLNQFLNNYNIEDNVISFSPHVTHENAGTSFFFISLFCLFSHGSTNIYTSSDVPFNFFVSPENMTESIKVHNQGSS